MAQYASGSIRFNGLGSDYNFDEMIDKLLKIESRQVTQLVQWKGDWQARLDALKELRGELMNLQSTLKSINSMDKFLVKATSSTDDKVATAVANGDAMNTNYKVEVERLATYSTWTTSPGWTAKDTVVADQSGTFSYSYKGIHRTLSVPKGTTVEGLLKLINNDSKNPGVRAQTIQTVDGISLQLRGMDTGKNNTLVIRDTSNLNGLDLNLEAANYQDGESWAELTNKFKGSNPATANSINASINDSTENKTFIYTVNGTRHIVEIEPGESVSDLVTKINTKTPGIATLTPQDSNNDENTEYVFRMEKPNSVYSAVWDKEWHESNPGTGPMETLLGKEFGSPNDKILNDGDPDMTLQFEVNSTDGEAPNNASYSISVNKDTTLNGLVNQLKFQLGERADVKIVEGSTPGTYQLQVGFKDKTHRVTVESGSLEDFSYTPPSSEGWQVVHGDNALVRINDYPAEASGKWLEVPGNTLKADEVIPGVTFNLLKRGETNISVYNDTEAMTENIQSFVDAVNSFRTLLMAYTKYDEEKETVDLEYSESLFDMQKGGLLQGNYGVQFVASRLKECIARSATGFLPRVYDAEGYAISGDVFSALSQIGITTCANESEVEYGLLQINYIEGVYGSKSLEQALKEDPEAVAELFATKGEGRSNTDKFHFDSYLAGITKAGVHEVEYEIDDNGNILWATVNGEAASFNNETHLITASSGTAKGLAVNVANYEEAGTHSGSVSIKEGKINDVLSLLEGTEGMLGSNGTFRNIEKNYEGIISNLEKKIKTEDTRLQKWEQTMILKFSRLETVLARYNQIQSDLDSQIAQLPKSSK